MSGEMAPEVSKFLGLINMDLVRRLQRQMDGLEKARPMLGLNIPEEWQDTVLLPFLWGMALVLLPKEPVFAEDNHKQVQVLLKKVLVEQQQFKPAEADKVLELMRQRFVDEELVFEEITIRGMAAIQDGREGWLVDAVRIVYEGAGAGFSFVYQAKGTRPS